MLEKPKFQHGRTTEIILPNGERRRGQFALVDLDQILASHNEATFADTPGYPRTVGGRNVNDRNYAGDRNAQALVHEYARNLEPGLLISTGRTPEGTPIVTPEGIVVSGNNRVMSAKRAEKTLPHMWAKYLAFLHEEREAFGFNRADFQGVQRPFLVRIDYDFPEYTTEELAKYNQATTKAERSVDKAVKLSNILRENSACGKSIPRIFADDETMSDFYADTNAQKQLLDMLLDCNLLTQQQVPEFYSDGNFTETGKRFIEMTLASIVLDAESLQAAETDGVAALRKAIVNALPALMENRVLPEGSLIPAINEAVVFQQKMKASGLEFGDFVGQTSMFGESYKASPEGLALNRLMNRGQRIFKTALTRYNASVKANEGTSLFGESQRVTPQEAFQRIIVAELEEKDRKVLERLATAAAPAPAKEAAPAKAAAPSAQRQFIEHYHRLRKSGISEKKGLEFLRSKGVSEAVIDTLREKPEPKSTMAEVYDGIVDRHEKKMAKFWAEVKKEEARKSQLQQPVTAPMAQPVAEPPILITGPQDEKFEFIQRLHTAFANGQRVTAREIKAWGAELGVTDLGWLYEAAELAWVFWYRHLADTAVADALAHGTDPKAMVRSLLQKAWKFYSEIQPTYSYSDSVKKQFQQFSTAGPMALLAGYFLTDRRNEQGRQYLEPSAGNGLLTVFLPVAQVTVNEIDKSRLDNLRRQGFAAVTDQDAMKRFSGKVYDGIIMNPPFGGPLDTDGEEVDTEIGRLKLEHAMAFTALASLKNDGRAALIIGGHTAFDKSKRIAQFRRFFNELYRRYNVLDIINIDAQKLYHKQGTSFPLRMVLIAGRKIQPYGQAPTLDTAPFLGNTVQTVEELLDRVELARDMAAKPPITLNDLLEREIQKLQIELD